MMCVSGGQSWMNLSIVYKCTCTLTPWGTGFLSQIGEIHVAFCGENLQTADQECGLGPM